MGAALLAFELPLAPLLAPDLVAAIALLSLAAEAALLELLAGVDILNKIHLIDDFVVVASGAPGLAALQAPPNLAEVLTLLLAPLPAPSDFSAWVSRVDQVVVYQEPDGKGRRHQHR